MLVVVDRKLVVVVLGHRLVVVVDHMLVVVVLGHKLVVVVERKLVVELVYMLVVVVDRMGANKNKYKNIFSNQPI